MENELKFPSDMKSFKKLNLDADERKEILKALAGDDPTANLVDYFSEHYHSIKDFRVDGLSYKEIFHLGSDLMKQDVPQAKTITLLMLMQGYVEEEGMIEFIPYELETLKASDILKQMPEKLVSQIYKVWDNEVNGYGGDYYEEDEDDEDSQYDNEIDDSLFDDMNIGDILFCINQIAENRSYNSKYGFYDDYETAVEVVNAMLKVVAKMPNKQKIYDNIKKYFANWVYATPDKQDLSKAHYNDDFANKKNYKTTGRFMNDHVACKSGGRNAVSGGYAKLENIGEAYMVFDEDEGLGKKVYDDIFKKVNVDEENVIEIERNTTRHGLDYISYFIGGDWENPVCIFIYHDGKAYRGYIPIHGNSVNTLNKSAFGHDGEPDKDLEYLIKYKYVKPGTTEFEYKDVAYNYTECLKDFECRVVVDGITLPYSNDGEPDPNNGKAPKNNGSNEAPKSYEGGNPININPDGSLTHSTESKESEKLEDLGAPVDYDMSKRYINDFIPFRVGIRTATAKNENKAELKKILKEGIDYMFNNHPKLNADLNEVDFTFENYEFDDYVWTTKSGINYITFWSGGDWEIPIYGIIYWDGKDIRGYVPLHGNSVNCFAKAAFGNEVSDFEYLCKFGYVKKEDIVGDDDGYYDTPDYVWDFARDYNAYECEKDFECALSVDGVTIDPSKEKEYEVFDLSSIGINCKEEDFYKSTLKYDEDEEEQDEKQEEPHEDYSNTVFDFEYDIITKFDWLFPGDEFQKALDKKARLMKVFHKSPQSEIDKEIDKIKKMSEVAKGIICFMIFGKPDDLKHAEQYLSTYVSANVAKEYTVISNGEGDCYVYHMPNPYLSMDEIEKKFTEYKNVNWTKVDVNEKMPAEQRTKINF